MQLIRIEKYNVIKQKSRKEVNEQEKIAIKLRPHTNLTIKYTKTLVLFRAVYGHFVPRSDRSKTDRSTI